MSVTVSRMWATEDAVIGMLPMLPCASCQNPVVQIAMTLPVTEANLDAATLTSWARVIDGGPFASLCWGERIAFDNPDSLTLLGALAAWTDRVRLGRAGER